MSSLIPEIDLGFFDQREIVQMCML